MNNIDLIVSSTSLESANIKNILPEPYADDGYFFFYYSKEDYKSALVDIVQLMNKEFRIYYDRKKEKGFAWEETLFSRATSFSCRAVVFYLSKNVLKDEFFWKLLKFVKEKHILYASINLSDDKGYALMPEDIISSVEVSEEHRELFMNMFNKDITFIPFTSSLDEKIRGLDNIGTGDPLIYNYYADGHAKIVGVKTLSEEKIVIPERVNYNKQEYVVDTIVPSAFRGCKRLKSIIIPNTIKHLGYIGYDFELYYNTTGMVFDKCENLTEVIIPDSVEELCLNNFTGCKNLKRIVVGNGIKKIRGWAGNTRFESINDYDYAEGDEDVHLHLDELVLTKSFKHLNDDYYFEGEDGFTRLDLVNIDSIIGYEEVTPIKEFICEGKPIGNRFESDETIEKIDLTNLKCDSFESSFEGCVNLKELLLPNSAKVVSINCDNCVNLRRIKFGENVVEIKDSSFNYCESLKAITFPKRLKKMNLECLWGMPNLKNLYFYGEDAYQFFAPITNAKKVYRYSDHSVLYKLLYPLIIWLSLFRLIFTRYFILGLLLFILFPISIPILMLRKEYNPTKHLLAKNIYFKNTKKNFKIPGYKKVASDKEKFILYRKK